MTVSSSSIEKFSYFSVPPIDELEKIPKFEFLAQIATKMKKIPDLLADFRTFSVLPDRP